MKSIYIVFICLVGFLTPIQSVYSQTTSSDSVPKIKVYYFHATNRCPTCLACEQICFETLQQDFKKELDNGTIFFKAVNIDEAQNKALVEQYRIMFSTLLFIDRNGNITDLTDKAFENALDHPDEYKKIIRNEVLRIMNN
jgi:hypothetical protein